MGSVEHAAVLIVLAGATVRQRTQCDSIVAWQLLRARCPAAPGATVSSTAYTAGAAALMVAAARRAEDRRHAWPASGP